MFQGFDWPFPDRWESVKDIETFYKERLYPALSDFVGNQQEGSTFTDYLLSLKLGNLTAGRVLHAGTAGLISDSGNLLWNNTAKQFTVTGTSVLDGAVVANESGADVDLRIEGDTATNLFVADAGLDAIQIGTTTAGAIADFRATGSVFNETGLPIDFRIESNTYTHIFYIDGNNERVGFFGTPDVDWQVKKDTATLVSRFSCQERPWWHWHSTNTGDGFAAGIQQNDANVKTWRLNYDNPIGTASKQFIELDAIDNIMTLLNVVLGYGSAGPHNLSMSGALTVESASLINQDLTSDSTTAQFSQLGLGVAPSNSRLLHTQTSTFLYTPLFERSGQTTNTVFDAGRFLATKTTDMGDGFGVGIGFIIQDNAAVLNSLGDIGFKRSGADNTGTFWVKTAKVGSSTERFALDADGVLTLSAYTSAGYVKNSAAGLLSGGNSIDEEAQDAVGGILVDSSTIDFTYNDTTPSITATVILGGVDHDQLLNFVAAEHIDWTNASSNLKTSGIIQIDGAGSSYILGKLGIGTTGPSTLLHIGDNVPTRSLGSEGLMVSGTLEVDGYAFLDNEVFVAAEQGEGDIYLCGANRNVLTWSGTNGVHLMSDPALAQYKMILTSALGRQFVISASETPFYDKGKDFNHAVQTNPTIFLQSATDPNTSEAEWGSLSFEGTGSGGGYFKIANGVGDIALMPTGNVGVGTILPDRLLHPEVSDAEIAAITYGQRLSHIVSTGIVANGFGVGIEFELEDAGGTNDVAGYIDCLWVAAAAGAEKSRIALKAMDSGGVREGLRIEGSGSAPLIGFLGANAVARQTYTAVSDPPTQAEVTAIRDAIINLGLMASS